MLGFFGKLFFGFLALLALLAILGFFLKRKDIRDGTAQEEDVLSQKTLSNVADLNDDFNRARYMDQDGQ